MTKQIFSTAFLFLIFFSSTTEGMERKEGFWLFGGAGAGALFTDVKESIGERNKTGYQVNAFGLGAYYFGPVVADVGLGWLYHRLKGSSATVAGGNELITTRALTTDLGVRWVVIPEFQIGPKVQLQFATDLSYRARIQSDDDAIFLGGLEAVYEMDLLQNLSLRLFAQFMTDLTVKDVQVYSGVGGLQLGFSPAALFRGAPPSEAPREPLAPRPLLPRSRNSPRPPRR